MFELSNLDLNRGDMTPFILMFLRVLNQACDEINEEMREYRTQLINLQMFLEKSDSFVNMVEKDIVYLLYQGQMMDIKISIKQMASHINKTEDSTRKYVKKLEMEGYVRRGEKGEKSFIYLSDELHEQIATFTSTSSGINITLT
jgi:DNA-binding MarR family transcriptional regulator